MYMVKMLSPLMVLEEVADPRGLAVAEQRHLDEKRPTYNDAQVANNLASSDPIPPSRIQQALGMLYRANGARAEGFLFFVQRRRRLHMACSALDHALRCSSKLIHAESAHGKTSISIWVSWVRKRNFGDAN
jgi:hypothetical protein